MADYFLTKESNQGDLDIWRMTCPGYVLHVKRVRGRTEDLMPSVIGKVVSVLTINPFVVACRKDIAELEGLATMECLESVAPSIKWPENELR